MTESTWKIRLEKSWNFFVQKTLKRVGTLLVEGFLWDDLRKISRGYQQMAKVPNDVETLWKTSSG